MYTNKKDFFVCTSFIKLNEGACPDGYLLRFILIEYQQQKKKRKNLKIFDLYIDRRRKRARKRERERERESVQCLSFFLSFFSFSYVSSPLVHLKK